MMDNKKLLKIIIFLSILGIVVSGYLLYLHYQDGEQGCDISETLSCSTVKESDYSEVFGIPMALIGLMGYVLIGMISYLLSKRLLKKLVNKKSLFYVVFIGLVISLYLTYAEFFIIKALCVFCLISFFIIALITVLSYKNLKIKIKEN